MGLITNSQTKVAGVAEIYQTTNYDQFTYINSNRPVDEKHVRKLMRKIEKEGNLTAEHPIEVNQDLEVMDGQHRLEALKRLGQPVYFVVRNGLNIENIASLNTGGKNWDWMDFARHWAKRGNKNYALFLQAAETEPRYSVLYPYLTGAPSRGRNGRAGFDSGELVITEFEQRMQLLEQYHELVNASAVSSRDFATACLRFMRNPNYNHKQMLVNVALYGQALHDCYSIADYLEALEDIRDVHEE
jgi:hypothetical protein